MSDSQATSYAILTAATIISSSSSVSIGSDSKTVQVMGTTTAGAGAATVLVEVSNDESWPWITAGTISLTLGTAAVSDGLVIAAGWKFIRARISVISGTGASVSVNVGV